VTALKSVCINRNLHTDLVQSKQP